ncbi:hypothetical protein [Elioraea sp.]|jgi:hypothetical protein|uniref:hypothetical protein n=1 Tax=Elioraea sp. TaxID=2185103 RepID=UPI0021DEC9CD|nr:hypothetical protein [Elioraea sp.]GIX08973.1 MAG: hypothetical protein KatS3mg116_0683 [Elioraea sp.]
MTNGLPTLFCDGIIEAHVTHGVVRITLGQAVGEGRATACGQLVLPLSQLAGTVNTLIALVQQVQERLRSAPPSPPSAAGTGAPPTSTPPPA